MLDVYLARSGGLVVIPDAVDLLPCDDPAEVRFVDATGKTLVVFKRADLIMYTGDGDGLWPASGPPDSDAHREGV